MVSEEPCIEAKHEVKKPATASTANTRLLQYHSRTTTYKHKLTCQQTDAWYEDAFQPNMHSTETPKLVYSSPNMQTTDLEHIIQEG